MSEFKKKQKATLKLVAKPFYMEGDTKVFVPIDNINSLPTWQIGTLEIDGQPYSFSPEPSTDGMKCKFTIPDLPATVVTEQTVSGSYSCDADLGAGVVTLDVSFTVIVLPEMATGVDVEEEVEV